MAQAKRRRKRKIFSPVYLTLVLIVLYLPILMVVIYSFNSGRTIGSWQGFTTDWYSRLFSNALMADALKNSLVLAVVSSLLAGGIGTLGAIGLARSHLKLGGAVETIATLPMMIPELVLGMAYLSVFTAVGFKLGMGALILTHTTFCILRNPLFINGQSDNHTAIFPDQRKDFVHRNLLSVYRVDHRLSIVDTHCTFHSLSIYCVNLKWKTGHALQFFYNFFHHGNFVNIRKSYIDIQNVRALILLRDRFFQDVVHIFIFQCFFEFFLSGRVDSFSDDTRHIIQDHSLSIRRYDRIMLFLDLVQRKIFAFFYQLFNFWPVLLNLV